MAGATTARANAWAELDARQQTPPPKHRKFSLGIDRSSTPPDEPSIETPSTAPSSLEPSPREPPPAEISADYWNFETYGDQIEDQHALLTTTIPVTASNATQFAEPSSDGSAEAMSQWLLDASALGPDDSPFRASFDMVSDFRESPNHTTDLPGKLSSEYFAGIDWDSTLWWDPSLVFESSCDNPIAESNDTVSQNQSHVYP